MSAYHATLSHRQINGLPFLEGSYEGQGNLPLARQVDDGEFVRTWEDKMTRLHPVIY